MSRQQYTLNDLQEYASRFGGTCLSKEYINLLSPLEWRCEKGHTWDADFQVIKQGGWCPACRLQKDKAEQLERLKNIAKEHGGECLSEIYINNKTRVQLKCKDDHLWMTRPQDLKEGKWCPYCQKSQENKEKLEVLKKVAREKGGKCLSEEYITNNIKLQFECAEEHRWLMTPHSIKSGQWCPKCGITRRTVSRRSPIEMFKNHAIKKGGKLLSDNYVNVHTKLLWQCEQGHQWSATGSIVIHANSWCPYCQGMYRDIHDMQLFAEKKGGKCLSEEYINSSTKLKWECSKGHVWLSAPYNIFSNCWCPTCGYEVATEKQRDSIEIYQKIAIEKGGKLLSDEYTNNRTPLRWQCEKGHQWNARPANVRHLKSWCPYCFDIKMGRKVRQIPK